MVKKLLSTTLTALVLSANIFGSGFQINEHGAKAMAMAGAFTAIANDASAVYFNPAGMTQLNGTHLMAGVTLISPSAGFRGVAPAVDEYKIDSKIFTPINLHFSQQLSDDWFVGISITNPYGLGTKWPKDWVGRFIAYDTELVTFFINPVVAYKVNDQLSVSAGVQFAYGTVKIDRFANLAPFNSEALVQLEGNGTAWGFNAAILYKATKDLSFGVSFRSEAKFNFEGDATSEVDKQLASLIPSGKIKSELSTPMNLQAGVAYNFSKALTVSVDFQYIGWSSYKELAVDFVDPKYDDLSSIRDYKNSFIIRGGAEYKLSDQFALRGGLLYDKNPVKDELVEPTLPDADRLGFNIGFGYALTENLNFDVAYMFLRFAERAITDSQVEYTNGNSTFNGVYNSSAHLFGVNFSYNF